MGLKELLLSNIRHLILFGGKGGVGKTSIAASAAVYAATHGKNTLLISSDPAHSLSDIFEQPHLNSGMIENVRGIEHLFVLEINPKEVLNDYRHYLEEYPEYKILMGDSLEHFPGSNEGFGLLNIIREHRHGNYDVVIVDTAPTGHTLRLLSFPDFLESSMMRFIRIKNVLGSLFGKIMGIFRRRKSSQSNKADPFELLEKMKNWAIEAREWLAKDETQFFIVMIPELLSIYETKRLISDLKEHHIQIGGLIANKLFPDGTDCDFCQAKRSAQDRQLELIKTEFAQLSPKIIPFLKNEIIGIQTLQTLSQYWI